MLRVTKFTTYDFNHKKMLIYMIFIMLLMTIISLLKEILRNRFFGTLACHGKQSVQ